MLNASPFVKWVGGKRRLLPEILKRLPPKIDHYHEPFVGGGAVFFALMNEGRLGRATLNDKNVELFTTYKVVRDKVDALIAMLAHIQQLHNETFYYAMREISGGTDVEVAARFIYLNKTCFNGVYRVNAKGLFNVPMGKYANPDICNADVLRRASVALRSTSLVATDFFDILVDLPSFDMVAAASSTSVREVVYLDSPYFPLTPTANFDSYTKDGFSLADHERLSRIMIVLAESGVPALLSNSDCPWTREAYSHPDLIIETVQVGRSINSDTTKRQKVNELLVSTRALKEATVNTTVQSPNT